MRGKNILILVLSIAVVVSAISNAVLFSMYSYEKSHAASLKNDKESMVEQIDSRNQVIDDALELNIFAPCSLSKNYDQIVPKRKDKGFNILTEDMCQQIIVPLYTPDGHYFGEISYAAYSAIMYGGLEEYNCLNDTEMDALHSYMNYITLNPGMSLRKY